ncbi:HEPN domain-containing protein [Sphingobacterium sp. N143]|uniref:HEPN domain-containing protein n=1 Tax=Sphingobacterium sp. N143 TaxID=2746727 RepID=UPI0025776FFB|nr:HEPN domain-containing protein [Sphingobacterium sp. N143]MDM1293805.1 HEPN domain-containing protein [Sphingobacterium sp. N143]
MIPDLSKEGILDYDAIRKIIIDFVPTIAIIRYGEWVFSNTKSRQVASEKKHSSLNLLVILDAVHSKRNESDLISCLQNRLLRITKSTVLIHNLDFVNEGLSWGQDFFIDIIEKGITIFKTNNFLLSTYFRISPKLRLQHIEKVYKNFHLKASVFLDLANVAYSKKNIHISIFMIHQSTELLMRSILVTHTRFDPMTHNLSKLAAYCRHITPQINNIFFSKGENDIEEMKDFRALQESYIFARYKLDYHIDKKLVKRLFRKVKKLERLSASLQIRLYNKLSTQF